MITLLADRKTHRMKAEKYVDDLLEKLQTYTLDPTFEGYGNFVIENPCYFKRDANYNPVAGELMFPNSTVVAFFGNFYDLSAVFDFYTDEYEVIEKVMKAIRMNQSTPAYKEARVCLKTKTTRRV